MRQRGQGSGTGARRRHFDLILSDVVMPGKDGLTLLEELKQQGVTAPVVMMSGQAHIEMAVRATRLGALDFLEKPISTDKLLLTVENALQAAAAGNRKPATPAAPGQARNRVEGRSHAARDGAGGARGRQRNARLHSRRNRHRQGTGRAHDARAQPARRGPFVTLNCAAVPAELIESELFGHEKGSFTGAAGRHIGKFEQADHGTIFLDEIGDMPLNMQAKLLRVLEEGEVERIGGDKPIHGECARGGGDASRSGSAGARREVPPGSVPPHLRFPADAAAVAGAARRYSRRWWNISPRRSARRTAGSRCRSRQRRCRRCKRIPGRAMFANCATWWSA